MHTNYEYTLRKKVRLRTLFVPYLEPSEKRVPKRVLYMFKNLKGSVCNQNGSKEPKKVLKMVLKTHLEPFREPLKVPPVGQPKNPFFLRVYGPQGTMKSNQHF